VSPDNAFTVTAIAPMPTTLGTIGAMDKGVGPLVVGTTSGSCSSQIDAHQIDLQVEFSADALPWRDALAFTTLVDGQRWFAADSINSTYAQGTSWVGRGQDRVYASCGGEAEDGSFSGLAEGWHQVAFEATLPGTDIVLTTDSVSVELSCEAGGVVDESDGASMGGCSVNGRSQSGPIAFLLLLFGFWGRRRIRFRSGRSFVGGKEVQ